MPLWQDAPRGTGAAAGLTGLGGAGIDCADATDKNARDAAIVAITTRISGEAVGIDLTGLCGGKEGRVSTLQWAGRIGQRAGTNRPAHIRPPDLWIGIGLKICYALPSADIDKPVTRREPME
jgi:hypothetical protein